MSHRHDGEILGGVLAIRMESLFRRGTVWTFRDITVRLVVQLASLSLSLSLHPSISTLRSRCVIIAYARIIYTRHVSSRGRADAIAR